VKKSSELSLFIVQSGERQACVVVGGWDTVARSRDWERGVMKHPPFSKGRWWLSSGI